MTVVDWSSSPPGFCSGSSPPPEAENREKKMTSEWWWFRQVFTISFKCICTKWVWLSTSTTVALLTMQVCSSRQIFWKEIACKLLYKSQKSGKTFFLYLSLLSCESWRAQHLSWETEEGSWPRAGVGAWGTQAHAWRAVLNFVCRLPWKRSYLSREFLVRIWSVPGWWSHLAVILQSCRAWGCWRQCLGFRQHRKHMYPNKDMLLLRERRKAQENRTCDFGELRVKKSRKGLVKICKWANSPVAMQCRDSCQPGVTTRLKFLLTKFKPLCLYQFCILLSWCFKSSIKCQNLACI